MKYKAKFIAFVIILTLVLVNQSVFAGMVWSDEETPEDNSLLYCFIGAVIGGTAGFLIGGPLGAVGGVIAGGCAGSYYGHMSEQERGELRKMLPGLPLVVEMR